MHILIIYAHPDLEGNCSLILSKVEHELKAHHTSYELVDLYKIEYDPVLHENELYTAGKYDVSVQNKEFQEKIRSADHLIFIYPVWWNSMPAMLKGFIDKVFTPRFAFTFKAAFTPGQKAFLTKFIPGKWGFMVDFGIPLKLLKGKKATVIATTSSPKIATFFILRNRFKTLMRKDMLGFFGIKATYYHVDNAKQVNDYQRTRIQRVVKKACRRLQD